MDHLLGLLGVRTGPVPASAVDNPRPVAGAPRVRSRWVVTPGYAGKPQARARFVLAGQHYTLPVTDPFWEQRLQALPTEIHPPEAAGLAPGQAVWLTISLGEPFEQDQCCCKLVAAVIPLPDPPPGAP